MRWALAMSLVTIIAFVIWGLFFIRIPEQNGDALLLVLGALVAKLTDVFGFSFGSSAGSSKKDEAIATMAQTANQVQSATPPTETIPLAPGETAVVQATEESPKL